MAYAGGGHKDLVPEGLSLIQFLAYAGGGHEDLGPEGLSLHEALGSRRGRAHEDLGPDVDGLPLIKQVVRSGNIIIWGY